MVRFDRLGAWFGTTAALVAMAGCGDGTGSGEIVGAEEVLYVDEDGQTVSVLAFPGQVMLFVPELGASPEVIADAAAAHGGEVVVQDSLGLLHLAVVEPGEESDFISAMRGEPGIAAALPNVVGISQATMGQVDNFGPSAPTHCPGVSHGDAVGRFLGSEGTVSVDLALPENQVVPPGKHDDPVASSIAAQVGTLAATTDGPAVINVSQGSQGFGDAQNANAERVFLEAMFAELSPLAKSGALADKAVVLAAANGSRDDSGGSDLTKILKDLYAKHPDLAGHVIVVGGSGKPGECIVSKATNFADKAARTGGAIDVPLMAFAPSIDVPIPGTTCKESGTSLSAPQVSRALREAIEANPSKPVPEVVKDFMDQHQFLERCDCEGLSAPGIVAHFTGDANMTRTLFESATFEQAPYSGGLTLYAYIDVDNIYWNLPNLSPQTIDFAAVSPDTAGLGYFEKSHFALWKARSGTLTITTQDGHTCFVVKGAHLTSDLPDATGEIEMTLAGLVD